MTNEEAIKLLLESKDNDIQMSLREWEEWDKRYFEAIDMAIEAFKQTAWIPCEERLPEIGHNILITNRQGYTGEGEYKGHNGYHHVWYQYRWNATLWEDEVLAWMPLPPAYSHKPTQAELEDIFREE